VAEFKVPELGENVAGGDVTRVLVKVGDTIAIDQSVVELETDKATIEVPSPVAGRVTDIRVKQGDKVKVGAVVLIVEDGAGQAAGPAEASPKAQSPNPKKESPEPEVESEETEAESPTPEAQSPKPKEKVLAMPVRSGPEASKPARTEAAEPNPKSQIPNPKSQIPNPKSQIPSPESQAPNPESRAPSPESQVPSPEPRALNPEPRIPSPESRVPNAESRDCRPADSQQIPTRMAVSFRLCVSKI